MKGLFKRQKIIFHRKNLEHRKLILLITFIFDRTFFLITSRQLFENDATLINHRLFFQRKDPPQLHRFQFLEINSLMVETIKKKIFQTQIFINKLLNLIIFDKFSKIGDGQVVENLFLEKMIRNLLESHHFFKFGKKQ